MKKKKEEYSIIVKDVHISYKDLQKFSLKRTLFAKKNKKNKGYEAIKGVSFNVKKGSIVGIIGQNGAGKSTLLRSIAGIFSPDSGSIDLNGASISLLSIGVGFNKRLSGIDNIYLSGMLLGFSEKEIKEKEKEIIEFADIGSFIYKPVRTYSSGMYSKLAFAITAILETDIMLIDEVLSVGDANFKEKSYNRMKELISNKDRTVLIVSHNTKSLRDLCDSIIWLDNGLIKKIGKVDEILDEYIEFMKNNI